MTRVTRPAKRRMKLYWNERFPNVLYYVGHGENGNPIDQVYITAQPEPFNLDSARWDLTNWKAWRMKKDGFEYLGDL